jgi:RNA polymerase sigma-70 factor (ECF subfamily)
MNKQQEESIRRELAALLPRLRRFARGLARDADLADDLVQDACERGLDRVDHFRPGTRLDNWMFRIVYTRWIDRLRRRKTRATHLQVLAGGESEMAGAQTTAVPIDAALDVKNALAALPEDHRAAILLVAVEGYSYDEAAGVLGVPVGTVASRVARARQMLGRMLHRGRPRLLHRHRKETGP